MLCAHMVVMILYTLLDSVVLGECKSMRNRSCFIRAAQKGLNHMEKVSEGAIGKACLLFHTNKSRG